MRTDKFKKISLIYAITLWILVVISMIILHANIYVSITCAIVIGLILVILHKHFVKKFNNEMINDAYEFAKQINENRMCRPDLINELINEIKRIK